MFLFYLDVPNSVIVGFVLMVALNIYAKVTKGVCNSTKRLEGKTIIITGANTGIGKETALDLALRGGRVILACRDLNKATLAKDDIVKISGNHNVFIKKLDLASLDSVREFAADVLKTEPKLHILINNAGCAVFDKKMTKDGLEYQMQTNYFGHFLLTNLLIGLMIETGEKEKENSRIINVSSYAHNFCKDLKFDDLNFVRDNSAGTMWAPFKIYGASKLCNILFGVELSNKLQCHGKAVTVNSLHPGIVNTEFGRFSRMITLGYSMTSFCSFFKTPKEGAQTTIYLAVADVKNVTGKYFRDCKIVTPSKLAQDAAIAKKLWEVSETIVKLEPLEKYF